MIDWYTITIEALKDLWQGFLMFLPKLKKIFGRDF